MKVADITDREALEACSRGSYDNAIGPETDEFPVSPFQKLGPKYPFKVILRKLEQLDDRGLIEYGVSLTYPWLTPEGNDFLRAIYRSDQGE